MSRIERIIVLAVLTGFTALSIVLVTDKEAVEAQRDDYRRSYEQATSRPIPTVTQRVASPPKVVTKTIRVTERASRSQVSRGTERATSGALSSNATLACIRKHESGNNYRRVSSSGTYRGAYQLSRTYSPVWAKRAGYGQWSSKPADQWPPAVQDAVAWNMGKGNGFAAWDDFTSYECPGFR